MPMAWYTQYCGVPTLRNGWRMGLDPTPIIRGLVPSLFVTYTRSLDPVDPPSTVLHVVWYITLLRYTPPMVGMHS